MENNCALPTELRGDPIEFFFSLTDTVLPRRPEQVPKKDSTEVSKPKSRKSSLQPIEEIKDKGDNSVLSDKENISECKDVISPPEIISTLCSEEADPFDSNLTCEGNKNSLLSPRIEVCVSDGSDLDNGLNSPYQSGNRRERLRRRSRTNNRQSRLLRNANSLNASSDSEALSDHEKCLATQENAKYHIHAKSINTNGEILISTDDCERENQEILQNRNRNGSCCECENKLKGDNCDKLKNVKGGNNHDLLSDSKESRCSSDSSESSDTPDGRETNVSHEENVPADIGKERGASFISSCSLSLSLNNISNISEHYTQARTCQTGNLMTELEPVILPPTHVKSVVLNSDHSS